MSELQGKIDNIATRFPVPNDDRAIKRRNLLRQMQSFYERKSKNAPEGQVSLFRQFVGALMYVIDVCEKYHRLTKELADLSSNKEQTDETRTNSARG